MDDPGRLVAMVDASTRITHRDPRAAAGACAIALAAHHAVHAARVEPAVVLAELRAQIDDPELRTALDRVEDALARDHTPAQLAADLGLARGVTGYVHHTVPICLHAWLRSPGDFRRVVTDVIELGGDADTTGAIAGALVGASAGSAAIPPEWLAIRDWPRSLAWLRRLGEQLARGGPPPRLWWPALPLRNVAFLGIVLATGLRRLLPPY